MSGTSEVDFELEMEYLEMLLEHDSMGEEGELADMEDQNIMSIDEVKYAGGMIRNIGDEDLEYDWLVMMEKPGVNIRAYYSFGTWFLNNWVGGNSESMRMGSKDMSSGGGGDISGVNMSSKLGDLSRGVVSSSLRLILFSIVGTESSSRKRAFLSRKGRWLSTRSWCPGPRRSTPWRARRRLKTRSGAEVESLAESSKLMILTMRNNVQGDRLVKMDTLRSDKDDEYMTGYRAQELTIAGAGVLDQQLAVDSAPKDKMVTLKGVRNIDQDKLFVNKCINIAGAEEQHLQQKVGYVSMVLESYKEDEIVAMECDLIVKQKEEFNARKVAITHKSHFDVTGRDTEAGGHAGQTAGEQPGQNEEGGPWDHGEGRGQEHGGQGGGQSAEEHAVRAQPGQGRQDTAPIIGDGFRSEFRKIVRAKRTYNGVPDGLIQTRFSDFIIRRKDATFSNLGGGSSMNIIEGKKRKVEREQFLRIKKSRPG